MKGRALLGHFQPRGRVGGETSNPGVRRPPELLLKLVSAGNSGVDWNDGQGSAHVPASNSRGSLD